MGKKPSKSWVEIQQDFDSIAAMPCTPSNIRKLRDGHVIDTNQSVRWNQEQVRLNREKNKCRDAVYEDIYKKIQEGVGCGLTRGKAVATIENVQNELNKIIKDNTPVE